jgi:hypothetical protein
MSIIAARFISFPGRDGAATTDQWVEAITDDFRAMQFHKDSPASEWTRFLAIGGKIGAINGPYGPLLTKVEPAQAMVGQNPIRIHFLGLGFTPTSIIVWNGGDEPTTMHSETDLSTGLDPSSASGTYTVPVWVREGALITQKLSFSLVKQGS